MRNSESIGFEDAARHRLQGWQDSNRPTAKLEFSNRFLSWTIRPTTRVINKPCQPQMVITPVLG